MKHRSFRLWRGAAVALAGLGILGGTALVGAAPAGATAFGITSFKAASQPTISAGKTSAAGDWDIVIPNDFVAGDSVDIQITVPGAVPAAQTCAVANDNIGFAATPGGNVVSDPANTGTTDTTPSITSNITTPVAETVCGGAGVKDLLTLTISNNASGPTADAWDITVTPVSFAVGSATSGGPVPASDYVNGTPTGTFETTKATGSDANVATIQVTANSPAVSAPNSTADTSISNVGITELQAGALSTGGTDPVICLVLSDGAWTAPSASANVVTTSTGTGSSTASGVAVSGATLSFTDTTGTAATTFTVTDASVMSAASAGPVTLSVENAAASCGTSPNTLSSGTTAYGVVPTADRIWGETADGTAAAQFEQSFNCHTSPVNSAIVAQDGYFSDALAAGYLAGELGTGVLLTNGGALSPETANAIAQEGVTTVYIVGGPDAVAPAVMTTLQSTDVTDCGGGTKSPATTLTVYRIWGTTAEDTAADIAAACETGTVTGCAGPPVGTADLHTLYTTNPYNDTLGTESSAPEASGALKTAIVASDAVFNDADAASALAYNEAFPILITNPTTLSSQVSSTLQSLGIQQVILMGGQNAMNDAITTAIQALGISVLRVAGQDYTDTAQLLAQFELNNGTLGEPAGFAWDDDNNMCVVRGDYFADSLGGGPFCANLNDLSEVPVLFTVNSISEGTYTAGFLGAQGALYGIQTLWVSGGAAAIVPALITTLQDDVAQG